MNLLKLLIPKAKSQEVTELESWTVAWTVYIEYTWRGRTHHKVFVSEEDRDKFISEIKDSCKFVGCDVNVKSYKN